MTRDEMERAVEAIAGELAKPDPEGADDRDDFVRELCHTLLQAARVDGMSGCRLCQS